MHMVVTVISQRDDDDRKRKTQIDRLSYIVDSHNSRRRAVLY